METTLCLRTRMSGGCCLHPHGGSSGKKLPASPLMSTHDSQEHHLGRKMPAGLCTVGLHLREGQEQAKLLQGEKPRQRPLWGEDSLSVGVRTLLCGCDRLASQEHRPCSASTCAVTGVAGWCARRAASPSPSEQGRGGLSSSKLEIDLPRALKKVGATKKSGERKPLHS